MGTTPITDAVELDAVAVSRKRGGFGNPGVQGIVDGKVEIDYVTAVFADEVIVGIDIRVETVVGTPEIDLSYQALIDQYVQITVHRSHAQLRKLVLQAFVEPVGGRVSSRSPKYLEDAVPLSASLVLFRFVDGIDSGVKGTPFLRLQSNQMQRPSKRSEEEYQPEEADCASSGDL